MAEKKPPKDKMHMDQMAFWKAFYDFCHSREMNKMQSMLLLQGLMIALIHQMQLSDEHIDTMFETMKADCKQAMEMIKTKMEKA